MYRQLLCLGLASAATAAVLAEPNPQNALVHGLDSSRKFRCDLPRSVAPGDDGFPPAKDLFSGDQALKRQVDRHSAIVRVPSISFDDMDEVDIDERWEVFLDLHKVLEEKYPNVHARMTKEIVNRLGLVYTLKGSDESLKPIMLAAHQDVVPVADPTTWAHPPFSGYFDGTYLWGRGSSDDKNSLTALMSALEALVSKEDWTPKRTIILAMGFDEETSGRRGAGTIAPFLEDRYGKDSMALILDEGGMGMQLIDDVLYALPAVTEKGHIDIWFELHVQGGHSSVPFPHTGIGMIAEIIHALETHPYHPKLIEGSPVHDHFVCQARYSPDADKRLTRLIKKNDLRGLVRELVKEGPSTHYRLQTSQSVDLVSGGQKINAMPEVVRLGVNYRVAPHDSLDEVKKNVLRHIRPVVRRYRLDVDAFEGQTYGLAPDELVFSDGDGFSEDSGEEYYDVNYNGTLVIKSTQETQPAHISPTNGKVWDLFAGTIRHTFGRKDRKVVPVGELMTGNTDTRHYLGLTRNVYRWVPTRQGESINIHTINERIDMHSHLDAVKFYYDLIRNFDRSDVAKAKDGSDEL